MIHLSSHSKQRARTMLVCLTPTVGAAFMVCTVPLNVLEVLLRPPSPRSDKGAPTCAGYLLSKECTNERADGESSGPSGGWSDSRK